MSVSVSVGPGTSLPQRAVLVPSVLGGATLPEPLGAVEWAHGFGPPGHTSIPSPCFPLPAWGKAAVGDQALTPPKPLCFGVTPGPRWDAVAARGGSDTRDLSQASSLSFLCKNTRSPAACQALSPSALLPCQAAWPVPSPPLPWPPVFTATSIRRAPGALLSWGGLRVRRVPAALPRAGRSPLLAVPSPSWCHAMPYAGIQPLSCCPLYAGAALRLSQSARLWALHLLVRLEALSSIPCPHPSQP